MSAESLNWEKSFQKGVAAYRGGRFEEALSHFNQAIANGGQKYNVYDSRAATFERLGNIKAALHDSRKVIDLAPEMRQGYLRAARLFNDLKKYDAADQIIQLGLSALPHARRGALENLRDNVREAKDSRRPCPFTKLPVEMVLQIFGYIVEADKVSPVVLSLVSRQWRTFVLSKPFYWEFLVLSSRNPINKAKEWMKRSKKCIRHLVLRRSISSKQLLACFDKLEVTLFKTLQSFHSEIPLGSVFSQFLQSKSFGAIKVVESLPCLDLEALQLSADQSNYSTLNQDADSKFTHVITSPPGRSRLHTLVVEYTGLNWSTFITSGMTSLQKLVLRWTNFRLDITSVLEANPGLVALTLEGNFDLNEARNSVEMSNLVQLDLRGPMKLDRFTSLVSFPALEQLELSGILSKLNDAFAGLRTIPTGLKCLHIRNCSFDTELLLPIISSFSKLEALTITHHGGDMNSIVDLLAGRSGLSGFAHPCLSQLNLSHSPSLTGGPLVRLVKGRLAAGEDIAKIKVICIDGCPQIDPSVPEWLKLRVQEVSCIYMSKKEKYRREWL